MLSPFAIPHSVACRSRHEAEAAFASEVFGQRFLLEQAIATEHRRDKRFTMPGICLVDGSAVRFAIDREWGAQRRSDGVWVPNWRERCVCPVCGLNNRQRALASAALGHLTLRAATAPSAYIMEQVTPLFRILVDRATGVECIGSEYLGHEHVSGEIVDGLRHEDVEHLSLPDASQDVVVSADVLEHVAHPAAALAELARVLKPGGTMFLSVPFYGDRAENRSRAELIENVVHHRAEPEYHGNPVAAGGSLVFTDFGWDLLELMRAAGFADSYALFYWNLEYGHLGVGNLMFVAER